MKKLCKFCKHWKNEQRELDYNEKYGFCDQVIDLENNCSFKFKLFVHNIYEKVDNDSIDSDNTLKYYKSELVAHENFGCIFFEEKKESKNGSSNQAKTY